jgi:hypothetical protein
MKNLLKLSLIALIVMMGCKKENKNEIEGAWKMVYAKSNSGDTLIDELNKNFTGEQVKIWSKENFLFWGRFKSDTISNDSNGGGTYKLDGTSYEEKILYFRIKSYEGTSLKMILEIKNDTLTQTWPVNDKGEIDKKNYNIEKYVRLD